MAAPIGRVLACAKPLVHPSHPHPHPHPVSPVPDSAVRFSVNSASVPFYKLTLEEQVHTKTFAAEVAGLPPTCGTVNRLLPASCVAPADIGGCVLDPSDAPPPVRARGRLVFPHVRDREKNSRGSNYRLGLCRC